MSKKKLQINIEFEQYESLEELSELDQVLVQTAQEIAKSAYAPYSKFLVGAAIRLKNGTVVTGNNQENIAYPSGLCAERVALFHAHAQYKNEPIEAMAIAATSEIGHVKGTVSPCGACRQVMSEYERIQDDPIKVFLIGDDEKVIESKSVMDFLPLSFYSDLVS